MSERARQITIYGLSESIERKLREIAKQKGISFGEAALLALSKGASSYSENRAIGSGLDHLTDSWSDNEANLLLEALKFIDSVDDLSVLEESANL